MANKNRVKILEIPKEFILHSLTDYQKTTIEQKYYAFNRFNELRQKGKKKMDCYCEISEDLNLEIESVIKMINSVIQNAIEAS